MNRIILAAFMLITFQACTPYQAAFGENNNSNSNQLPVKGRQGILINQKLSFGDFSTSKVKRSWTKGGNSRAGLSLGNTVDFFYPDIISKEYMNRDQTFYFQLNDKDNNVSDVYASSAFKSEDLLIGNNPNSIVNIFEDVMSPVDRIENMLYLQVYINNETRPWQLVLDNQASQDNPDEYLGVFAQDEKRYYTLKPITKIAGKKGTRPVLFGSVGYEIFDVHKKLVAAVSLIDSGVVLLQSTDPSERFLLSNLCGALLLQQQIDN